MLWQDSHQIITDVGHVSKQELSKAANRIDQGHYPLDIMGKLGRAGAFAAHLDMHGNRFDIAILAMQEIARSCGSTGFLTWCHDVCGLYMEQSGNPALLARLPDHTNGNTFGGTALSNPMKSLSGIESMLLNAKPVPGGYHVSGTLPWVSHIKHGQYCGAIAAVNKADGSRSHEIMFLLDIDDSVSLRACPEFSGMEGTSTWSVTLDNYFVGDDNLIADPAAPFISKIKGAFILLQAGMATGVIQRSIDEIRAVETTLGHVNQFLQHGADELDAELNELSESVVKLAKTPYEGSKDFLLDVLDARCYGAELALKASQSSLMHQGAKGYLMSAAPQRLIREAHFVAIVTPAMKHLRWEMNRLMSEDMPK
ncbi:MAG: acyl-CoA dehydrogenase family protein [Pseudomonadota bacterium]|nr:acyl-CoA dehydrogenase family protein [Pseudomonadota bacterium]